MPNNIQTIIDKLENELYLSYTLSSDYLGLKEDFMPKLKDFLTSLLDSIKKELPEAIQIKHEDWLMSGLGEYRKGDVKSSHNNYRQEVINIINSHR